MFKDPSLEWVNVYLNPKNLVKSEYDTTDMMDFSYLPERNCYETLGDCVIPHFDEFTTSTEELAYSHFLTVVTLLSLVPFISLHILLRMISIFVMFQMNEVCLLVCIHYREIQC